MRADIAHNVDIQVNANACACVPSYKLTGAVLFAVLRRHTRLQQVT